MSDFEIKVLILFFIITSTTILYCRNRFSKKRCKKCGGEGKEYHREQFITFGERSSHQRVFLRCPYCNNDWVIFDKAIMNSPQR